MRAAVTPIPVQAPARFRGGEPASVTLLELVGVICEETDDDEEVVATVLQMIRSGQVRLCGNFRGTTGDKLF